MSFNTTKWSIENLAIKDASAKAVLNSLSNALNSKTGECNPSISRIMRETALSRPTVIRKIKWLQSEGWISIEKRSSPEKGLLANHYTIHKDRCHHDTSPSKMVIPVYKEDIQGNILSVSSLRSETESSVCSQSSQTDILSNAQARENPKNEKLEQKSSSASGKACNSETEKSQTKTQSPAQEPKQQRQPQAETLTSSETSLRSERDQVAPPTGGGLDGAAGEVSEIGDLLPIAEKPFSGSLDGQKNKNDVKHQTGEQNAPASLKMANKAHSKAVNRKTNYVEDFEAAWKAYPTTPIMSKKEAFGKWQKLGCEDKTAVARAIPEYLKFLKSKPDHPVVHFCRFISQRRFDGLQPKAGGNVSESEADKPKSWLYDDPASFSDVQWGKILYVARTDSMWWRSWGAMPGEDGCLVPKHILRHDDGFLWKYDEEMTRQAA